MTNIEQEQWEPKTIGDFILPFRREDNAAWEKANLFGRICFPIYIVLTAMRTLGFWFFFAFILLLSPIIAFEDSKAAKDLNAWIERVFKAAFCKPNAEPSEAADSRRPNLK